MKKLLIIAGVVVVLIGGGFAYLMMQDDSEDEAQTSTTEVETFESGEVAEPAPSGNAQPGAYVDYQESLIASTPGTKVLFFHAPWCPQCQNLESEIEAGTLPENTTIFKVDYDSNQELRQKYGVTLQTTLVKVDDNGNLIARYVAYDDPTLDAIKQNIL